MKINNQSCISKTFELLFEFKDMTILTDFTILEFFDFPEPNFILGKIGKFVFNLSETQFW